MIGVGNRHAIGVGNRHAIGVGNRHAIGVGNRHACSLRLRLYLMVLIILINVSGAVLLVAKTPQSVVLFDSLHSCSRTNPPVALHLGFQLMDVKRDNLPDTIYAYTPLEVGYILDKQGFPIQALGFFSIAVQRLKEIDQIHRSGYLHIDIGNIYFRQKEYDKAREKYVQAEDLFQHEGNNDGVYTAVNNMALIESAMGKPRQALHYLQRALKLARSRTDHPYLLAHSYQYISSVYDDLGMQDSLLAYQDSALAVYIPRSDENLRGLIHRKAAEIYLVKGDTTAALSNIRKAAKDFRHPLNIYECANLFETQFKILRNRVARDSLISFLQQAESFCDTYDLNNHQLRFLQERIKRLNTAETVQALAEATDKYIELVKEKEETANRLQLERLDILTLVAQYQNSLKLNRLNLRNAQNIRNAAILIGLLLLILLMLLIRRYQNKKRTHHQILAHKELLMKRENELHQQQIKAHKKKLEVGRLLREKVERELLWKTTLLQKQNIGFEDFEAQFVKVFPGFFDRLSEINPKLTAKDKKICAYHRMNLETKEIAVLCSLSVRTVESARYRLKKKLGIQPGISLQEFISTL